MLINSVFLWFFITVGACSFLFIAEKSLNFCLNVHHALAHNKKVECYFQYNLFLNQVDKLLFNLCDNAL